jgi:hypothetical protein
MQPAGQAPNAARPTIHFRRARSAGAHGQEGWPPTPPARTSEAAWTRCATVSSYRAPSLACADLEASDPHEAKVSSADGKRSIPLPRRQRTRCCSSARRRRARAPARRGCRDVIRRDALPNDEARHSARPSQRAPLNQNPSGLLLGAEVELGGERVVSGTAEREIGWGVLTIESEGHEVVELEVASLATAALPARIHLRAARRLARTRRGEREREWDEKAVPQASRSAPATLARIPVSELSNSSGDPRSRALESVVASLLACCVRDHGCEGVSQSSVVRESIQGLIIRDDTPGGDHERCHAVVVLRIILVGRPRMAARAAAPDGTTVRRNLPRGFQDLGVELIRHAEVVAPPSRVVKPRQPELLRRLSDAPPNHTLPDLPPFLSSRCIPRTPTPPDFTQSATAYKDSARAARRRILRLCT